MTISILVNCYEDFELRFSLCKISLCKKIDRKKKKKKKATKDKKTLQMMHLNLQHPQEKDCEKGSHSLSLNFFNQPNTNMFDILLLF